MIDANTDQLNNRLFTKDAKPPFPPQAWTDGSYRNYAQTLAGGMHACAVFCPNKGCGAYLVDENKDHPFCPRCVVYRDPSFWNRSMRNRQPTDTQFPQILTVGGILEWFRAIANNAGLTTAIQAFDELVISLNKRVPAPIGR